MPLPTIEDKIKEFHGDKRDQHDRDRSWEHCYRYFQTDKTKIDKNRAALELGFYLASWGMYRGSSFLLQYAYTIHEPVVNLVLQPRFSPLWDKEFGSRSTDASLASLILELCQGIRKVYLPFAKAKDKTVRDTLLTKVVLGTVGCFPAWDTYFDKGYRQCGFCPPSQLNVPFIQEVLRFCFDNLADFQREQTRLEREQGVEHYPLMKLEDMYFHQIGVDLDKEEPGSSKR